MSLNQVTIEKLEGGWTVHYSTGMVIHSTRVFMDWELLTKFVQLQVGPDNLAKPMSKVIIHHAMEGSMGLTCTCGKSGSALEMGEHYFEHEPAIARRLDEIRKYPSWVCDNCAKAAGGKMPAGHCATYHADVCGVCKEDCSVTEPRDWGYPNFNEKKKTKK